MAGSSTEPWIEKVLRESRDRGEFDDLPGAGKPIGDLDRPYDPAWWARKFAHRERLRDRLVELAATVRRELPGLIAATDRHRAQSRVDELNARINALNEELPGEDRMRLVELPEV
jgi:hypothetical protein